MNAAFPIFLVFFAASLSVSGQVINGFRAFVFYDTTELARGQTNRLKTILFGDTARPLPNGLAQVKNPRIEHFSTTGQTNLIAISPECFFDDRRNTIFSTNVLAVTAGTNEMRVQGRGYFGMLTNLYLIFSNDVRTVIRQELAESVRSPGSLLGGRKGNTNSTLVVTNSDIHVQAERLHLDYQNNIATYFHDVQVENAQVQLNSDHLEIKRSKTNNVESILAQTNVVIRHKFERSEATGDRAYYFLRAGQEMLELSGSPARWHDGNRLGKAETFIYEPGDKILRAQNQAMFRFPRGALNQTDWLPGRPAIARTNTPAAATNLFVELHGQAITTWLSTTNRPGTRILAETNVLIIGEGDGTWAAAQRATYDESTGELRLVERAEWQQGLRTVKGDHLQYDRTNQVFVATGNAYLKVPVGDFARRTDTNFHGSTTNLAKTRPQRFLEMFSDRFDYRGGYLTFNDRVRGMLLESNVSLGTLSAEYVKVKMSNQIERVMARRNVHVERFPVPTPTGKAVSTKLDCEALSIDLRTNGTVHRIMAQTNVVAQQTSKANAKATPSYSRLAAESVFAEFFAHTNDVRELIAERDVFIMRDQRSALGQKAVYTATNSLLVLSGNPSVDAPELRVPKAEAIIYDRARDKFFLREPEGQAKAPAGQEKKPPAAK